MVLLFIVSQCWKCLVKVSFGSYSKVFACLKWSIYAIYIPFRNQGITMILLDFSPSTLIICVITFMLGYSLLKQLVSSNVPPGPFAFPLIGCLPFLERKAERTFGKWAKKYGPVITVQLGWNRTVMLNSYEAVVQVSYLLLTVNP